MPWSHHIPIGMTSIIWMINPRRRKTTVVLGVEASTSLSHESFLSFSVTNCGWDSNSSASVAAALAREVLDSISPLACPERVLSAKEKPTHILKPVTLHSVVARAAAASSTPFAESPLSSWLAASISPRIRRVMNHGILDRTMDCRAGKNILDWIFTSRFASNGQGCRFLVLEEVLMGIIIEFPGNSEVCSSTDPSAAGCRKPNVIDNPSSLSCRISRGGMMVFSSSLGKRCESKRSNQCAERATTPVASCLVGGNLPYRVGGWK
mmetsp:Transcript_9532/g.28429  ORF Transcript_9532/g.28429 Transcript_9532/m.28429 type:complete len:265 (+) Transcript_9532:1399-2193(+)